MSVSDFRQVLNFNFPCILGSDSLVTRDEQNSAINILFLHATSSFSFKGIFGCCFVWNVIFFNAFTTQLS